MLEQAFHLLSGYVEFEVRGDSSRFFNVAAKRGFTLWGFERENGLPIAKTKPGSYKSLRPVCRRCHVKLRLRKKRGIPFHAARLKKRKGLIAGAVLAMAVYLFFSSFFWGVSVSGTQRVTEKQILESAKKQGVYVGASKLALNPKRASKGILSQLPQLSWASVNTDGCFLEVVVKEGKEKPEIRDYERWSNMIAVREGRVVQLEAQQGRPEVKLGDIVKKGDLLISGLYQEKVDPYGPQPDQPLETQGPARGSVMAETYREFTVQVSGTKKEMKPTGEEKVCSTLSLFGLRIPLGINAIPQGDFTTWRKTWKVRALGEELPLSLERRTYRFLKEEQRSLSKEEMEQAALLKLRRVQRAQIPDGGRVEKEELSYSFGDGICILQAKCRCVEEIGEIQEILVN